MIKIKQKKVFIFLALISLTLLCTLSLINCSQTDKKEIKIGVISPLTGPAASFGIAQKNGSDLAAEELNVKGGINGMKINLIYEDSQLDPNKALSAFKKLTSIDKVTIVIGQGSTSEILAMSPSAEKEKVILISPGASGAKISEAGDYIFRISPSDAFQGAMGAKFALKKGYKKGVIIFVNNDWGTGLKDGFKKDFEKGGGELVLTEAVDPSTKDFRTILTKIKSINPDFIYIPIHPDQAGVILKQIKELAVRSQLIGADSFSEKSILTVAGNAADGVIFTMPVENKDVAFQDFQKKYKEKYKTDASYIAAASYDTVMVLAKAISEAGADTEKIKRTLYSIKNYKGASGDITFDEHGDVVNKSFSLMIIKNGKYETYTQ